MWNFGVIVQAHFTKSIPGLLYVSELRNRAATHNFNYQTYSFSILLAIENRQWLFSNEFLDACPISISMKEYKSNLISGCQH